MTMQACLPAAVLIFAGLALYQFSWGTWPDPLLDFGRELYVPWQLGLGKVLYRDLAYFNGPLSAYFNAFWFKVFGVSLQTLVTVNAVLLTILTFFLFRVCRRFTDPFISTLACLVFLVCCGFGCFVGIGNYNFLTPYSHELTHGFLLSVLAVSFYWRFNATRKRVWFILAALAAGCTLLTKLEASVAVLITLAATMLAQACTGKQPMIDFAKQAVLFLVFGLVPIIVAVFLFLPYLSAERVLPSLFKAELFALRPEVTGMLFYHWSLGIDHLGMSFVWIMVSCLAYGLWVTLIIFTDRAIANAGTALKLAWVGSLVMVAGFAFMAYPIPVLLVVWRGLPVLMVLSLMLSWRYLQRGDNSQDAQYGLGWLMGSIFSLSFLLKIFFNARIHHYGFILAAPAVMMGAILSMKALPKLACRFGGNGTTARLLMLSFWCSLLAAHIKVEAGRIAQKTYAVGKGGDVFVADSRALPLLEMMQALNSRDQKASLAVLPEGAMVNYLLRRENPTGYLSAMPLELIMFGEQQLVAAYRQHPPRHILVVDWDASEYGLDSFGKGYGRQLADWIEKNYVVIKSTQKAVDRGAWGMRLFKEIQR